MVYVQISQYAVCVDSETKTLPCRLFMGNGVRMHERSMYTPHLTHIEIHDIIGGWGAAPNKGFMYPSYRVHCLPSVIADANAT